MRTISEAMNGFKNNEKRAPRIVEYKWIVRQIYDGGEK